MSIRWRLLIIIIISAYIMRHINRRCSANNGSLHQMLNTCLFSALPKASEDLLSERRETGRAFHVAGPQQWNPHRPMLVGTNSWPAAAERNCWRSGSVSTRMQTSAIWDGALYSGTCAPTSPPCMLCARLQYPISASDSAFSTYCALQIDMSEWVSEWVNEWMNANSAVQAWCGRISVFLTPDASLHDAGEFPCSWHQMRRCILARAFRFRKKYSNSIQFSQTNRFVDLIRFSTSVWPILSSHLRWQYVINGLHHMLGTTRFGTWPASLHLIHGRSCRCSWETRCKLTRIRWRYTTVFEVFSWPNDVRCHKTWTLPHRCPSLDVSQQA